MNVLHSAKRNFIQAQSSEKIKRALRHQLCTYSEERYENGDKVFYRCKNYRGRKGPTLVLGQDGQFVLVQHSCACYRIQPSHLMKVIKSCSQIKEGKNVKQRVACIYSTGHSQDNTDFAEMNENEVVRIHMYFFEYLRIRDIEFMKENS